jgi:hypothetical protein
MFTQRSKVNLNLQADTQRRLCCAERDLSTAEVGLQNMHNPHSTHPVRPIVSAAVLTALERKGPFI